MKITVITVSYNSVATIAATLQSVASQTYSDVEHIVVDGASSDGTMDVVGQFASTVSTVICEPDRGIYDAMNKGLRAATGDLIGFLNADDVYTHKRVLQHIAAAAMRHPDDDAIYGDLVYVSADETARVIRHWRSGPFSRTRLKFGWMPPHPTFYVRRRLVDRVGLFDDRLRVAGDYDYVLRCLGSPGVHATYIPEVLVRMQIGGVSNESLQAVMRKMREDITALRRHRISRLPVGFTLLMKNVRKLPQLLRAFGR